VGNSTFTRWSTALAVSAAAVLLIGPQAQAETVEVTGRSGGPQSTECGYISQSPNHTVQVTDDVASLDIRVTSSGHYSLLVQGDDGFSECVMAHTYDGGAIQSIGAVTQGTYRIYVGDFDGASHPFTLTIDQ